MAYGLKASSCHPLNIFLKGYYLHDLWCVRKITVINKNEQQK